MTVAAPLVEFPVDTWPEVAVVVLLILVVAAVVVEIARRL